MLSLTTLYFFQGAVELTKAFTSYPAICRIVGEILAELKENCQSGGGDGDDENIIQGEVVEKFVTV